METYLLAARRAADHSPYPGFDDRTPDSLATLHVRQMAAARLPHADGSPSGGSPSGTQPEFGRLAPADAVFAGDDRVCVLIADAGGGKSTLLRRHLAEAADYWLDEDRDESSRVHTAVPVLIRATALAGTRLLPRALALAVTDELATFGLREELPEDFFGHRPRPGTPWLVMVDGLDEIPDRGTRTALLERLAREADGEPAVYRFVVATRPVSEGELDRTGLSATRFELQPFTTNDLRLYGRKRFSALPGPDRHVEVFTAGLRRSRLAELARTPLMAFVLCQLYAADPARPLPQGRAGAYRSFVESVYEQNIHKRVRATHDEAIRSLTDRHQIPPDRQAVEQAAQAARDHLPRLIDYMAHERINGNTAPAVEIMAAHVCARRPATVNASIWHNFLGDLLRPTGLLTERSGDLGFPHRTVLEYHAARHATRDEQARAQVLDELFTLRHRPTDGRWRPPDLAPSYVGFLLDGLLAAHDDITAATHRALERLAAHGGRPACFFLARQVRLRTNLPVHTTAGQLADFADDDALDDGIPGLGHPRVEAVAALAELDGYREEGAERLARFAADTALNDHGRVAAAVAMTELEGYESQGAGHLARFAAGTTLDDYACVAAAVAMTELEGYESQGARHLARFAADTTRSGHPRLRAGIVFAQMDGHAGRGAALLAALGADVTLDVRHRMEAAWALAELGDQYATGLLADFAGDTTVHGDSRVRAAWILAVLEGHREDGAELLAGLAADTALRGDHRVGAAIALAVLEGHQGEGAELLTRLAADSTLKGIAAGLDQPRAQALAALAVLEGHRETGTASLAALAAGAEEGFERLAAAAVLAHLGDDRAAGLLTRLTDTAVNGHVSVRAARTLAESEGHQHEGAELLAALATDPTRRASVRVHAAIALAELDRQSARGVELLAHLAADPVLPGHNRAVAAAALDGHGDERAATLLALAALFVQDRRQARRLASVYRYNKVRAVLTARTMCDTALNTSRQDMPARLLTNLMGKRAVGQQ